MKVDRLILKYFRGTQELELNFAEGVTVLAGVNGAGKSTVLDALAILLSWVVARIRSPGTRGKHIADLDINNLSHGASIDVHVSHADVDYPYRWFLTKYKRGHKGGVKSMTKMASFLAEEVRDRITETNEQCSIPLFAYYPVNRAVLDIPLRIKQKHTFDLLDAYEDALESGASFKMFLNGSGTGKTWRTKNARTRVLSRPTVNSTLYEMPCTASCPSSQTSPSNATNFAWW